MRFGDTVDTERLIQWQFLPPTAPLLDRVTVFGSTQWGDEYPTDGPGEVVGSPRIWVDGATSSWPYGSASCGTDPQWETGFGSGPLPSLPLSPDGIPVCCTAVGPIVTACCPGGLPSTMYAEIGADDATFMPLPPQRIQLMYVPGSSPPTWAGSFDRAPWGGMGSEMVEWACTTPASSSGMKIKTMGTYNIPYIPPASAPLSCSGGEWEYFLAFVGVVGTPPITLFTAKIRDTSYP